MDDIGKEGKEGVVYLILVAFLHHKQELSNVKGIQPLKKLLNEWLIFLWKINEETGGTSI